MLSNLEKKDKETKPKQHHDAVGEVEKPKKQKDMALECFANKPETVLTIKEIMEETGLGRKPASQAILGLCADGEIVRVGRAQYKLAVPTQKPEEEPLREEANPEEEEPREELPQKEEKRPRKSLPKKEQKTRGVKKQKAILMRNDYNSNQDYQNVVNYIFARAEVKVNTIKAKFEKEDVIERVINHAKGVNFIEERKTGDGSYYQINDIAKIWQLLIRQSIPRDVSYLYAKSMISEKN